MYVCLCHGVTDRRIREAADAGVTSLADLAATTGCATACGSCSEVAQQLLDDQRSVRLFPLAMLQAA